MSSVGELRDKIQKMKARFSGIREKADHAVDIAFGALEVSAGAAVVGGIDGWNEGKDMDVVGVPVELLAAGGLHAFGFFGGSKHGDHLHNLGNGFLAGAAFKAGRKMGKKMADNKKAGKPLFGEGETAGELPEGSRAYGTPTSAALARQGY